MIISKIQNTRAKHNYINTNCVDVNTKQILPKNEVSFEGKEKKPKKQPAKMINDGINDFGNVVSSSPKSDLDNAPNIIPLQEFLQKEHELIQQNTDLHRIDLPKIEIPEVPNLELENLNLADNITKLSDDIDMSTKSRIFRSALKELGVGAVIFGATYYFLKKSKKQNKNLDKKA